MVDPTRGIGLTPGIVTGTRSQETRTDARAEDAPQSQKTDTVEISSEALDLASARKAATAVREALADSDLALGVDADALENIQKS